MHDILNGNCTKVKRADAFFEETIVAGISEKIAFLGKRLHNINRVQ